jgi:hypothetical protein
LVVETKGQKRFQSQQARLVEAESEFYKQAETRKEAARSNIRRGVVSNWKIIKFRRNRGVY